MTEILLKYKFPLIGAVLGAIGGYAYYKLVGCNSGTCPIWMNAWSSILYGAAMGGLGFNLLDKQ